MKKQKVTVEGLENLSKKLQQYFASQVYGTNQKVTAVLNHNKKSYIYMAHSQFPKLT